MRRLSDHMGAVERSSSHIRTVRDWHTEGQRSRRGDDRSKTSTLLTTSRACQRIQAVKELKTDPTSGWLYY
jgi:hypothetical protein